MMWLPSLAIAGIFLFSIIIIQLIVTIIKNRLSHRFFELKSPNLPVLPNPNILSGHSNLVFWSSDNWRNLDKFHRIYGKTYGWYNVHIPTISTTDLDLIKTMIIDEPNDHVNKIDLIVPLAELRDDEIAFAKDKQWWRLRKAFAPAFTNHKVMSPNVQDEINTVIDRFMGSIELKLEQTNRGKTLEIDTDDIFGRYSVALVFSCFYKQTDIIDFDSKEEPYVKMIDETFQNICGPLMKICPILPIVTPITEWIIKQLCLQGEAFFKVKEFIKKQTLLNLKAKQQIRKANSTGNLGNFNKDDFVLEDGTRFRRNMVDHIIDQFQAGKLTETEYMHSTTFLFLAAAKTTADGLSRLAYHLAAHQDVQARLRESILADGMESEYLHWCISESLRLFPPVMSGCSRTITRDIETKSGLIPAGTFVLVPSFTIHRSKEVWGPDANEFNPDRWRDAKNFHPVQYLGFGAGKRNCLGKDFAINAVKRVMMQMIARYKFLPSQKTDAESIMKFESPIYIFLNPETPTCVELCRI